MSLVAESPLILQRLRGETRLQHEALEQNEFNRALQGGAITPAITERFLAKLYGFLLPYEARLRTQPFGPEWEIESRLRAHLIRQDLGPDRPLPLCPAMPVLDTWPQLLGAMYVLEGSTLGGQLISRQLAKAGIDTRAYFSGNAERTGPLWKSFCQLLSQAAADTDEAVIVQSATQTFQQLHAWIDQS